MADEQGPDDGPVEELSTNEIATSFQEVAAEVRARRERLEMITDGPRPREGGKPYKRRRYMIDLPLQLSYVGVYMSTLVLLVVGFIALNYVFSSVYQRALKIQTFGMQGLEETAPEVALFGLVNFVFVMLLLIGAAVYAIVHSHRVAGPAFRLKVALRQVQARDYDFYVQLRTKDFLKDLAEQVNTLNQSLKAKDIVIADAVMRLDEAIREAPPEVAERLQDIAADLSDVVLPIEQPGPTA
jgi:methyl-accepting chemotaxis protein